MSSEKHEFSKSFDQHYCDICHNLWDSSAVLISKYQICKKCGESDGFVDLLSISLFFMTL